MRMNKLLDAIDKYKFGLIAALMAYIFIFMYLQMESYTQYIPIEPFNEETSYVEDPQEIPIKQDNILAPADMGEVKNMSQDANDSREKSNEKYFQNKSSDQVMADYKALEQQMYDEAGGDKTRAQIKQEVEARKKAEEKKSKNNTPTTNTNTQKGGNTSYGGNVMVKWKFDSGQERDAHQNNIWYVRNPGYTCPQGSAGTVVILIKVSQSGNVTTATYDASQSGGANACMIEQALKYAKMSRFAYSSNNSSIQSGKIIYTFISQ